MPPIGLRRALIGLAVLGFGIGLVGAVLALTSDHESGRGVDAFLVSVICWGFIGTGLYAWARRPGSNIGPLMAAVGFAGFLNALSFSGDSVVFTIGQALGPLFYAVLIHLLLSFPSGSLDSRFERFLVVVAYLITTVVELASYVFTDPVADGCEGCPANPLFVDNSTAGAVIDTAQGVIAITLLAAVVVILYRRWRASTPSQRRAVAPVLAVGGFSLGVLLLQLAFEEAGLSTLEDLLAFGFFAALFAVPFAFLAGLLRSRFSRAEAVSSVVGRLGEAGGRGALRDALAEALGDPTLELAYWVPEQNAYVDADGHPVRIDSGQGDKTATVVEHDGAPVAAILHDADLEEDPDLVQALGAATALTLENERLDAELRAKVEELRASRARIVTAAYAERRRLERDLHDGAQQRLMALTMNLRLARNRLDSDPHATGGLLDEALGDLSETTSELRELARGIHPAVLTDRGLEAALTGLAGRAPVPVEVLETPGERLPGPVESAAYFVVSEALTNVARYAEAGSASVRVAQRNGAVEIEVRDDGVGGADPGRGSGLRGLADRVAALDGRLEVVSPKGRGTTVRASIPCA